MTTRRSVEVGDEVVYTPAWLHSTGQAHTDIAHYRGRVLELRAPGGRMVTAKVAWTHQGKPVPGDDGEPWCPWVNVLNIARLGTVRSVDIPLWVGVTKAQMPTALDVIASDAEGRRVMDERVLDGYKTR